MRIVGDEDRIEIELGPERACRRGRVKDVLDKQVLLRIREQLRRG